MTIRNALSARGLRTCYAAAFIVGTGLAISTAPAYAGHDGTTDLHIGAGEIVSNTVTLTYSVGGVEQTDNPESTETFVIDRMIDVQVAGQTSPAATPGDTAGELYYTLENQGNDTQAYALTAYDVDGNFTSTSIEYSTDGGATWIVYVPGTPTPDVAPGGTLDVKIVGTVLDTLADGATVQADLLATTLEPTGSTYGTAGDPVAESGATTIDGVDTVFVDAAADGNLGAQDPIEDGEHSDVASALVAKAALTVTKSVIVIDYDPNGQCATMGQDVSANQAAISGACIEYTLTVSNAASPAVPVEDVLISDILPSEITFVSFIGDVSGFTDEIPDGDVAPAYDAGTTTVSATEATIAAGETISLRVRALIN